MAEKGTRVGLVVIQARLNMQNKLNTLTRLILRGLV